MQIIFCNSERVESPNKIHFNHLGFGVFETFLLKFNQDLSPRILGLDLHLQRLKEGCDQLGLKFQGFDVYNSIIEKAIKEIQPYSGDCYRLRIIVYEKDWFFQVERFEREVKPLKLKTVVIERFLPEVKSCSALPCIYSQQIAASQGFDEALLLDRDGIVRETSWGNFFWFDKEKVLHTAGEKILKGITRELVLKIAESKVEVKIGNFKFKVEDIYAAFTCRSTSGISNVLQIDDKVLEKDIEMKNVISNSYEELYSHD